MRRIGALRAWADAAGAARSHFESTAFIELAGSYAAPSGTPALRSPS